MHWWILAAVALAALYTAAEIVMFRVIFARNGSAFGSLMLRGEGQGDPWSEFGDAVREGIAWSEAQAWQHVETVSHDGLRLCARYLPAEGQRRVILCAHGYRGSGFRDFSMATRWFHEHGCGILLIDQRAHGGSGGKYITFGALERYDVRLWAEWLCKRVGKGTPVYLDGISMGAATVLMASDSLPEGVAGIIADCGFTTPHGIIKQVMQRTFRIPAWVFLPGIELLCRALAGFSPRSASAPAALSHCSVPVLLVHGLADPLVPYGMTEENFAACASPKDVLYVEGAVHGMSYPVSPDEYIRRIEALFARG